MNNNMEWLNQLKFDEKSLNTQRQFQALSVDQIEGLKFSALDLGASDQWIADILQRYGSFALANAVEFLRNGFSPNFVWDMLKFFGPVIFGFLIDLFVSSNSEKRNLLPNGRFEDKKIFGSISGTLIALILIKVMPVIFEKYGPAVLDAIRKSLINAFSEENDSNGFEASTYGLPEDKIGNSQKVGSVTGEIIMLILVKVMPIVIDKYGKNILDSILKALVNSFQGEQFQGGDDLAAEVNK
jgi:hypothetical protein